jgi:LuxR family transcriptional regulator, maltose regulon positive regulatory protein
MAAWWLDDDRSLFAARERAFQLYRQRGDRRGAGRVAIALGQDHAYFRGEPAVAAGWFRRAHRLLGGMDLVPEHGWLKLGEGDFALSVEADPEKARRLAAGAAAVGRQLEIVDLEMIALALEGLALVCQGRPSDGMPRLDEATTAAVSGEMQDPFAVGFAYCYMVQACERAQDYDRAAQWSDQAKAFGGRIGFATLGAICRTQQASVLVWRGAWAEAEAELETALRHLRAARPPLQWEGVVRLARLRRVQGRLDEAAALLEQAVGYPPALVERAALALDRGTATLAVRQAERFLRLVHTADVTARIPGLEVSVRSHLAVGDHRSARGPLEELRTIARSLDTLPLRASVRLAEGLFSSATGAADEARTALEDAAELYRRCGAPLETGRARLELARVLLGLGERDGAEEEARTAARAFASLGAMRDAERAERFLTKLTPFAASGRPSPRRVLTPRELDVLRSVALGLSNARIALRLHVSEFTVKRHVANILDKLDLPTRAAAAVYGVRHQLV